MHTVQHRYDRNDIKLCGCNTCGHDYCNRLSIPDSNLESLSGSKDTTPVVLTNVRNTSTRDSEALSKRGLFPAAKIRYFFSSPGGMQYRLFLKTLRHCNFCIIMSTEVQHNIVVKSKIGIQQPCDNTILVSIDFQS